MQRLHPAGGTSLWCLFCIFPLAATAATHAPTLPTLSAWSIAKNETYVVDARAQLAWARCVEGMRWDGLVCAGTPQRFTHNQATAWAQARGKTEGVHWRLPRAAELHRLAKAHPPGTNPVLFPGAPSDWHWSSTASIETAPINAYDYNKAVQGGIDKTADRMVFLQAWAVHLDTGETRSNMPKTSLLPIRLVRAHDAPLPPERRP